MPAAQPLVVTSGADDTRRSLASLRAVDGHPLNQMTTFPLAGTPVADRGLDARYRTAAGRLDASAGRLDPGGAMALLREVAQPHTRWSVGYDLTARTGQVVAGRRYGAVRSFRLAG